MEKRLERIESLSKSNVRKMGILTNVVLAMYLAINHKDKKGAQIPFLLSLILLNIHNMLDVIEWFGYVKEDEAEM